MRLHLWTARARLATHCSTFHLLSSRATQVISNATPQSGTLTLCLCLQFYIKSQKCFVVAVVAVVVLRTRQYKFSRLEFLFQHIAGSPVKCHDNYLCMCCNGMGQTTDEMEWFSYFSILPFSYGCCCCRVSTIVTAFRYFSHLSFVLHLVKNEVFDTFFSLLPILHRHCQDYTHSVVEWIFQFFPFALNSQRRGKLEMDWKKFQLLIFFTINNSVQFVH